MTSRILRWLALALLFASQAGFAVEQLTIGVFAFRDKAETARQWQPLADYLERALPGYRFKLQAYTYGELGTVIERRQVDFVLSHAAHYVTMRERNALSSPLATLIERDRDQPMPVYGGAIIVRADRADIAKLADLKGKTVATSSTEGFASYQMQAYELHKIGLEIPGEVNLIQVGLPIDRTLLAVLEGKADAAFARMGLIEQMAQEGKLDPVRIKVINPQRLSGFGYAFSTTLYPLWPFVTMPQVPDSLAARVAAALLMLPHDGEVARAARIWGFTIPADYGPVEEVMRALRTPPFDEAPEFTWRDVWRRYTLTVGITLAAGALILLLLFWLAASRRKLAFERQNVMNASQELREKTEALLRSNTDLEQFAYSVSHDMRQPLRAVAGHLRLLERNLQATLDEDNRENLAYALEGARRMDSMIVSLLDYSRVGRKTEAKQWIESRQSLDEALGFLAQDSAESCARVDVSGEWPRVFASRDELIRLFQNLIGNAIKYREPDRPPCVEVESARMDDIWRVSVRDQGIGIDPQQIDRLFHFFSRLQSRARFEGTGMGLALCKRIVEHHDGRIWAESKGAGQGSTFLFEMPLKITDAKLPGPNTELGAISSSPFKG